MEKTLPKVLQIDYNPGQNRLTWDGYPIHCGQSLEVLMPDRMGGTWQAVSCEFIVDGWYIPRHPGVSPVGLWAREIDR